MPCCVCAGASITCSFGAAPSVLNVLPGAGVMSSQALASIMDNISVMNIMPFVCAAVLPIQMWQVPLLRLWEC